MSYSDFTLSTLVKQFGIELDEKTDLFSQVSDAPLRPEFAARVEQTSALALKIATEKARSEFIIAPVLTELWQLTGQTIGLFSGIDFTIDPMAGLSGICDYIVTRSEEQYFVTAPVFLLVEAKNEDMKRGYAQCLAEMIAAQRFNEREGAPSQVIYGAVTVGNFWKFLDLRGTTARIDKTDYYIRDLAKVMGILLALVR